jgi:hypothetical protein
MGWWKEVPYRGDGKAKDIKPRRRFINIKNNRRETIVSILAVFAVLGVPIGCLFIFGQAPGGNDSTEIASVIIGLIFLFSLMIGIISVSKFRRGYDIEVRDEAKDEKDKSSKELNKNTIE